MYIRGIRFSCDVHVYVVRVYMCVYVCVALINNDVIISSQFHNPR